jgi:DNA-binding CsgD family transcriptional regulator
MTDAISIVEAASDLEGDMHAWLARLAKLVAPRIDQGMGTCAILFDAVKGLDEDCYVTIGMNDRAIVALRGFALEYPAANAKLIASGGPMTRATEGLPARSLPEAVKAMRSADIADVFGVPCRSPDGFAVVFAAPTSAPVARATGPALPWGRLTAHVAAGARLRRAAVPSLGPSTLESPDVEAVLSPSGVVKHAEGPATTATARESLRRAAKSIDRARSKARGDDDEALALWQGLVTGRWSLVDRFDSDGHRYLVARRNDPRVSDPRALTLRERQVLAYAAMGEPLKVIAYALGLPMSTISQCRTRAMRKLGVKTQAELTALFAAGKNQRVGQ